MTDLRRVSGPTSPFQGRTARVIAVVLIAILVAMLKPWGDGQPPPVAHATVPPTVAPTPASPSPFDPMANYDHELFGVYEPEPKWELWPAGYLVSFGYAIRIESTPAGTAPSPTPSAAASGDASAAPSGLATLAPHPSPSPPASSPAASIAPAGAEPNWPATITIIAGNHLAYIGVNTPIGYRLTAAGLTRTDPDGTPVRLKVVTPESQWPTHFTVIGMTEGTGTEPNEDWPAGHYHLTLDFEPGAITRTVDVVVLGPGPDSTPEPGGGASPSPASGSTPSAS